ncbi:MULTISPECIES: hypothetical protein [unclassified Pseudomonas]|uniref:hypothetical protein n=1 Tax=unclassified Pseudomonas TaxID=196821 RepID=UPI0024582F36|nr:MULTISPECIES: hypothetical protein [unclassified Pseudomonas]MDH4561058.1 hypothetical protein [Pseudomonas sp. BN411]MDH4872596.1 hypothetical protein [Pseudomonas sp. BN515]
MTSRLLAILLGTLLTLPAFASTQTSPADSLLKLHQMRLAAQRSLGDFYMYNGMEGDQRYARLIDESVQQADARLKELGEMPGEASKVLRTQLTQEWQSYNSELTGLVTALKQQGFTDLQPVADLTARNKRLMDLSNELYAKIQQEGATQIPPLTQRSRDQSLLMQTIAVDYASRSASIGGSFMGGNGGKAIDELAGEFANQLASLEQAPQNTPEIRQALDGISTKWRYIEKSLKNYNENSVPFLINKYSDRIIDGLEDVSARYSAAQS